LLQAQVWVPGPVLLHVPKLEQGAGVAAQLSISLQVTPSPLYPVLQEQVCVPGPVLVQVANPEHTLGDLAQLSISLQVTPSPL
jgi:hypothetical protein